MKYSNGFWNALFNDRWIVETGNKRLVYTKKDIRVNIAYPEIHEIRFQAGIIWNNITIVAPGRWPTRIDGLLSEAAEKLTKDITQHVKKSLAGQLQKQQSALSDATSRFHLLLEEKRYLAHADIRRWMRGAPDIGETLANPFFSADDLPREFQILIRPYTELVDPDSPKLKARNEKFVEWALDHYDELFGKLENTH